jgi:predicted KAP-like P-loop ATPase
MTGDGNPSRLLSDAALDELSNDELGYREFAADMATTIHSEVPDEEFVVGINGQWGSGKSTIVNFIEKELDDKDDSPTIIRFNPWWFSDDADLIEKYLSQLSANLDEYDEYAKVRENIADYARTFSKLPLSSFGIPLDKAAEGAADIADTDPPNLNDLHEKIASHLSEYDDDIVVLIDDIDRLPPAEIRHMSRVIKSVAAFPNITYVVAYDEPVVTEALEGYQGVSDGREYLEKIIQLPLDVPIPHEGTLHQFLSDRLNRIHYQSDTVFEEDRWEGAYHQGIKPVIETPRDAIRLVNAVSTAIRGIESEVNFVDEVCLETIRLFAPSVYGEIRSNKGRFTDQNSGGLSRKYMRKVFEEADGNTISATKTLMCYLFPPVDDSYDLTKENKYKNDIANYDDRNRIYAASRFPIYFRRSIGEAEMTQYWFSKGISATENAVALRKFLQNQLHHRGPTGRTRAYNFIAEFQDRVEECLDVQATLIALLKVGDEIVVADPPHNKLDLGAEEYLVQTAGRLLASQNLSSREETLQSAVTVAEAPYTMVELLHRISMAETFGAEEITNQEKLVSDSALEEYQRIACGRIDDMAYSERLFDAPHLQQILEAWVDWDEAEGYKQWRRDGLSSIDTVFQLVEGLVETGQIYKIGKSEEIKYIDPEWLEPFISPRDALQKLQKIEDRDEETEEIYQVLNHGIRLREDDRDTQSLEEWEELRIR